MNFFKIIEEIYFSDWQTSHNQNDAETSRALESTILLWRKWAGMQVDESLSKHGQTIPIKVKPYLNFAKVKSGDVISMETICVARAKS